MADGSGVVSRDTAERRSASGEGEKRRHAGGRRVIHEREERQTVRSSLRFRLICLKHTMRRRAPIPTHQRSKHLADLTHGTVQHGKLKKRATALVFIRFLSLFGSRSNLVDSLTRPCLQSRSLLVGELTGKLIVSAKRGICF